MDDHEPRAKTGCDGKYYGKKKTGNGRKYLVASASLGQLQLV
jgi:hypothetical protein